MKKLILSLMFLSSNALSQGCENYCVGVRGNGEAEPAHLAALSRMVEEFGMPKMMAGGSSATVTMFLSESMQTNPHVAGIKDEDQKRKMQALMLKSMPEFMAAMTADAKITDAMGLMKNLQGGDDDMKKKLLETLQAAKSMSPEEQAEIMASLGKYGGILNPELLRLVAKDPARFASEAQTSVTNLGKFNAVTDNTLFFRPGVVDFKEVALVIGYMADFYAGNTDDATKQKLEGFLEECSDKAFRKEWGDVDGDCKTKFRTIAADYLKAGQFQNKAVFEKVGAHGNSLPTTSVVQGEGIKKYSEMKRQYLDGTAKKIEDFSLDVNKDISFGYWGKEKDLDAASKGLEKYREEGDLKAKRFRALGEANWFEVLATSPAEPGIANAQSIPVATSWEVVKRERERPYLERWKGLKYRKDAISTGGWSDLHPTAVLKAQPGCEHTVYLTRQASYGDSRFGQQIFIRLTGTKNDIPFWDKIGDGGAGGWCPDGIKNAKGDPEKVAQTPWNKISNLCNPQSSFRRALDAEDASFCTDWDSDKYNVFKGQMRDLVKNAYESPMIPTSAKGMGCALNSPPANPDARGLPGCLPYPMRQPGSTPVETNPDGSAIDAR